jgi:hypothetical protein
MYIYAFDMSILRDNRKKPELLREVKGFNEALKD